MPPLGLCLVLIVVIWGGLRTEPNWSIAEAVINQTHILLSLIRVLAGQPGQIGNYTRNCL